MGISNEYKDVRRFLGKMRGLILPTGTVPSNDRFLPHSGLQALGTKD
jgi:hypothetical protein